MSLVLFEYDENHTRYFNNSLLLQSQQAFINLSTKADYLTGEV